MRILFITLLLIGCPKEDESKNTDSSPKKPQPSQTGFTLNVVGTEEKLADTLQIADFGMATVVSSDPERNGNRVEFKLSGCARSGVKLFSFPSNEVSKDDGSLPVAVTNEVGADQGFLVIDTSGSKDAVSGCALQARVTNSSGGFDLVEKNVIVREGNLGFSNPTLTAAGVVSVMIEKNASDEIDGTWIFKVEREKYILAAASVAGNQGQITDDKFSIDTLVIDWKKKEQEGDAGELPAGRYLIVIMTGKTAESSDEVFAAAMGGIAVSL